MLGVIKNLRANKLFCLLLTAVFLAAILLPSSAFFVKGIHASSYVEDVRIERAQHYNYEDYGLGIGHSTWAYTVYLDGQTTQAYCLNPASQPPESGTFKVFDVDASADFAKVLYYGSSMSGDYNFWSKYYPQYTTDEYRGLRFIVNHLASSKMHGSTQWISNVTATGEKLTEELVAYAKSCPAVPKTDMSLSNSNVRASIVMEDNVQRTPEITLNADVQQTVVIDLPDYLKLVNVTTDKKSSAGAKISIKGGDTFYFEAPIDQEGSWNSGRLKGALDTNYTTRKIMCNNDGTLYYQNLGYLAPASAPAYINFNITWATGYHISITKSSADPLTTSDNENFSLAGAVYSIQDVDGVEVCQLTTGEDGKTPKSPALASGIYSAIEVKAPAGFILDPTPMRFSLNKDVVDSENSYAIGQKEQIVRGDIEFTKVDAATNEPLSGIPFKITSKATGENHVIVTNEDGFASTASSHNPHDRNTNEGESAEDGVWFGSLGALNNNKGALPYGSYTVEELLCDNNKNYSLVSFDVTINEEGEVIACGENGIVTNSLKQEVHISKVDATSGKEIAGAHLVLKDSSGDVVEEWISTDEPHVIKGVKPGTYTLTETIAPDGYVLSTEEVVITVTETAAVTSAVMKNELSKLVISKQDLTSGKELPGAKLQILDEDGEVVEEWVSTSEPHEIDMLPAGDYVLREETAPDGYLVAEDVEFTITAEVVSAPVVMKDDYTKVDISKQDLTTGKELPGATLKVLDNEGNVIEEWVSSTEPHRINKLPVGDYILHEETAPDGYLVAEDVKFSVKATGEIQKVVMKDESLKAVISKQDITTGEELPGAKLQILDENGDVVEEWVSTSEPHEIDMLPAGDYVLREETAPDGYLVAEDVEFSITGEGLSAPVVMKDDYTKVNVAKVDSMSGIDITGAKLALYTLDSELVEEWISDSESHRIEKIKPGSYILREILAPEGYFVAEDMEIEVKATGEVQVFTMKDEAISIEGQIDKRQTLIGNSKVFEYTIDYRNTSNTWVDELNVTDALDCVSDGYARLVSLRTPVSIGDGDGFMNVWYQTNKNDKNDDTDAVVYSASDTNPENPYNEFNERVANFSGWKIWKADVSTSKPVTLKVVDLDLGEGEYVTAIRFEHGYVDNGFTTRVDESLWDREGLKAANDNLSSSKGDVLYYWSVGTSAKSYHSSKDCVTLDRVFDVASGSLSDAKEAGKSESCSVCGEHDSIVSIDTDYHDGSSAVLTMSVTDMVKEKANVKIANTASVDLHRNLVLEDVDEDVVVQNNPSENEPFDKTGVSFNFTSVALGSVLLIIAGICIFFLVRSRRS